jgi:NAD(P)-dependent dehydrogenase (short-subunit alcohol dehydrogenase family)
MRLAGRVALVSACGAGESYGAVWARALARDGAAVVVADADPARAAALASELAPAGAGVAATGLDVQRPESWAAAVALAQGRFGRLDVLAATHHVWHDLDAADASEAYLLEILDRNAVSLVRGARAALPAMRAAGGGRIVALSSIGAWDTGTRIADEAVRLGDVPSLAYPASKQLQNGLVRLLARALGPAGITVNAIAPGMIASPATLARLTPAERDAFVARTALRRLLRVEDTVGALLHLVSDDAARTTGQVLVVDAGLVMLG